MTMISESLAVRLRPKTLDDVVGQKPACDTIKGMIKRRNLPNALLITGDTGSGKTTLSRIIGHIVNCEDLQGYKPCGKCASCKTSDHPDFIEMNIGDARGIDAIRGLQEQARFKPRFNMRIFLLDECHQLTKAGASCLLKLLEEPPAQTVFILATTDPEKMLNTIVGRCVKLNLRRLLPSDMLPYLNSVCKKEKFSFGDAKLRKKILTQIVDATGGQPRDSLQLLEAAVNIASSGNDVDVLKTFNEQFDLNAGVAAMRCLKGMYTGDDAAVIKNCSTGALFKMLELHTCGVQYKANVALDYISYERRTYLSMLRKCDDLDLDDMIEILNVLVDIKKEFTTFTIDDKQLLIARLLK